MNDQQDSIRIDSESDEYEITTVEPVPPTWRDVWAILRGRYEPKVRKVKRLTVKGMHRVLKQTWTVEAIGLNNAGPLTRLLGDKPGDEATVPIRKTRARRT